MSGVSRGKTRRVEVLTGCAPDWISSEMAQARAVFERLVSLEADYDPALGELYSEDGVIVESRTEAGSVRRDREIPARRYRAALPGALTLAQKAGERFSHQDVSVQHLGPGWVAVRTLRSSSRARRAGPYELVIRRDPDGAWRICKETATLML